MNSSAERPIRSFYKAVSWRITGSLDTILLSWIFTQNMSIALAIGLTEVITKMVLYYTHERVWARIGFGRNTPEAAGLTNTAVSKNTPRPVSPLTGCSPELLIPPSDPAHGLNQH